MPARSVTDVQPASHATTAPLARACGVGVPGVLVAIAGLHAAWALGSPWPAASERELAERVLSERERERLDGGLPPAPLTWAVAIGVLGAATVDVIGGPRDPYERLDLTLYSPLCLALGAGTAIVARGANPTA